MRLVISESNFTIQGIGTTTDGSTDLDAGVNSRIIGLLMQMQGPASIGVEVQSYATTGDPIGVLGRPRAGLEKSAPEVGRSVA